MADAVLEGKANAVKQVLEAVKGDTEEFIEEGKGE
jgi:small subunit ribosomal protein S2